jgi:FAD dependent oxidoreductase
MVPAKMLPAGHWLAKRRSIALRELTAEPMILLDVPPSRTCNPPANAQDTAGFSIRGFLRGLFFSASKSIMTTPHATIIGAGIVGMSTAAFLQRTGYRVTVIDRLSPGQGCSFGNAGGLAFAEIYPAIHPRILLKIPGWLMDPLGPLTVRWSYLPMACRAELRLSPRLAQVLQCG